MMNSRMIAVVCPMIASSAYVLEICLIPLLLPHIQQAFDLTVFELTVVFNSYAFAVAFAVIAGGFLGDAYGQKRIFGLGVFLFVAGGVVVALAPGWGAAVLGRTIQGVGGGLFSPLIPVLLSKTSLGRPARILVLWGSVSGFVVAFAPLLIGAVLVEWGWRSVFMAIACLTVPSVLVLFSRTHETGAVGSSGGHKAWTVFRNPALWLMYVYVACTYGAIMLFLFLLPLYANAPDFPPYLTALAMTLCWLSFALIGLLLRNVVDDHRVKIILLISPAIVVAGFALLFVQSTVSIVLAAILIGSGFACCNGPSTAVILRLSPRRTESFAASLDITFARLGAVGAVAVFALLDPFGILLGVIGLALVAISAAAATSANPAIAVFHEYPDLTRNQE